MAGTIQTGIDLLPATGAEVKLLDGTYNIATGLVLDSYQTLKGSGWNTILTTPTAYLEIVTAIGSSGSEKTGIIIADLQIDGTDSNNVDVGIRFEYVDDSVIQNVYSHGFSNGSIGAGIILEEADFSIVVRNLLTSNLAGIELASADNAIINHNNCRENIVGIWLYDAEHNTVTMNPCRLNTNHGIFLEASDHNFVSLNPCSANSQATDNTYDDIRLAGSDYNTIQGNPCRAGGETNKPKYGINIYNNTCNENKVINNDLYDDGFGTAPYNDDGTGTIYVEPGIDDTPVNGETGQPISSNWAYDHENAADPHPVYYLTSEVDDAIDADITTHAALDTGVHGAGAETLLNTGDVGTMAAETATDYLEIANLENPPTEDEATKAPTSEWAFDHDAATTGIHGVGANHIAEAPAASHLVRTFTKGWTSGVYLKGAGVDTNPTEVEFPYFGERRLVYFHDGSNHTGITAVVTGTGSVTQGVFNTLVLTGATNGSTARQYHTTTSWHLSPVSALTLPFFTVQPFHDTNVEIWYVITSEGTGYPTLNGSKVGFIFEDGKIYAHDGNGASNNKEEICSYSTGTVYVLRLIYSDSTVKFYVNGVLEATHPDGVYTEALPAHAGYRMMFAIKNTAAAAKFSALLQFAALKDLS